MFFIYHYDNNNNNDIKKKKTVSFERIVVKFSRRLLLLIKFALAVASTNTILCWIKIQFYRFAPWLHFSGHGVSVLFRPPRK